MEAISAKYDLDLNDLNKIASRIIDSINESSLNIDTLQKLDTQLDNIYGMVMSSYIRLNVHGYKRLSLEFQVQLADDLFKFIKDSYESRFTKEYTLIVNNVVNNVVKNFDTIDEIKKYYDFCIEFKNEPTLYKNGKVIKAEELTPIKTIYLNQLLLSTISNVNSSYDKYEYKNTIFTSYRCYNVKYDNTKPWLLYTSQKNMQYLIKNDFPTNTKGIVYRYKDNDDKLAMETISKTLSGFPPIIMVDVLTEDIKNEILEFLL